MTTSNPLIPNDVTGPWQRIPDEYRPSMKDQFYPRQLQLGIGANEDEMREFAKNVGLNAQADVRFLIDEIKAYCTERCELPYYRPRIRFCRLAYPNARYGFYILCNYDLSRFNPPDFDRSVFLLQKVWQDAGLEKKTMWHISALNSRPDSAREVRAYSVVCYMAHNWRFFFLRFGVSHRECDEMGELCVVFSPTPILLVNLSTTKPWQCVGIYLSHAFFPLPAMVNSLVLRRSQVFQHLQNCTEFAESIRFEFGVYAVITYMQTVVSLCVSINDPFAVSILYPQRSIYSARVAEVFPSQGYSHVVPDAVQALGTLSTERATASKSEGLEFAQDGKRSRISVIRTNPMALNSRAEYELVPGRRETLMHHLALWEAKKLDPRDVIENLTFADGRDAAFYTCVSWSDLTPSDVIDMTDSDLVPQLLLQVLHAFSRYEGIKQVRLALVIGGFIAVLEWKRPPTVSPPALLTTFLQRNASILAQHVPQSDYSPSIVLPLRLMMENGAPSAALRAALYHLYIQDVQMASIVPQADIFDIGYFAGQDYNDPTFHADVKELTKLFDEWWVKAAVTRTPEQERMQMDQIMPEDVRDHGYVPHETPSTNSLWR